MNKLLMSTFVSCALILNGCSAIWNNFSYQKPSIVKQCPSSHWPYIVDSAMTVGAFTLAALFQSGIISFDNSQNIEDNSFNIMSILFAVYGSVFAISTVMGVSDVVNCRMRGEQ